MKPYNFLKKWIYLALAAAIVVLGFGQNGATAAPIIDPVTGLMIPDYFGVANWANSPPLTKFVDKMAGLGSGNANLLGQYIPVGVPDTTTYASTNSDYYEIAVVEYEEKLHTELPPTRLRGYVQIVPSGWSGTDLLGNVYNAVPLTTANGLVQNITINGNPAFGASKPHYLGPAIVAMGGLPGQAGKPVRIKFYNLLPTGTGGNLFIPVDTTIIGAGVGPDGATKYTQNRATLHNHGNNTVWISDGTPHQWITPANAGTAYPQGVSVSPVPDMGDNGNPSDGTMTFFYSNAMSARLMFYHDHALGITRLNVYAGEAAGYLVTDVVEQDLIKGENNSGVNPGPLKVLPGIGIPLVIQDKTFVDPTTIGATDPTWLDPNQPTFGTTPGTAHAGDLWFPHVYMPAQNPWDMTGTNPFGRWMYGPWFYPPTANIDFGPVPNEYYQPDPALPNYAPWEPPMRPGIPNPSMPGEAFMDTPLVNGTVFPYLEVEPKAYRFRILNACNDRFLNLQLYVANPGIVGSLTTAAGANYTDDPVVTVANAPGDTTGRGFTLSATADTTPGSPTLGQVTFAIRSVGSNYTQPPVITVTNAAGDTTGAGATATAVLYTNPTEVGMVPVTGTDWLPPFDASGVPDKTMAGPNWIQIGTEGGFLPAPVVIPAKPITWNTNPTTFNFGTVNGHSLLLGSAERGDVIVDFSAFPNQTLILYNDAPAAFPAPVPTYDYYTNSQDLTGNGGVPPIPPGVGPNTRTIMQIRVGGTVTPGTETPQVTLANLQTVWAKGPAPTKRGVFEVSQDPIIVPQVAYNSAYGKTGVGADTFTSVPAEQFIQVNQYTKTFKPIDANGTLQSPVTLPIQPKAAHDEMGGVYDTMYGRMSGMLGLELPATTSRLSQFLAYPYASPPVDIFGSSTFGTLVGTLDDGTQIWNITHNGVDTHPIHTHLFNAQLINRVGWDGIMLPPDANELGWKETFRMNPLEQIFIAMRPMLPTTAQIPFMDQVPNSVRLIDPTRPENAPLVTPPPAGWFDTTGVAINSITNHKVNFGWEYVYHCHILAHEEMDMMHGVAFAVPPPAPLNLFATAGPGLQAVLTWIDNSLTESGFTVQRATDSGFTANLTPFEVGPNVTTYTDTSISNGQPYYYRVFAVNKVGDVATAGFPTKTVNSVFSNTAPVTVSAGPIAPNNLQATILTGPTRIRLTWRDNSNNETSFAVWRSVNGGAFAQIATVTRTAAQGTSVGGTVTYTNNGVAAGNTYAYYVTAVNASGPSAPSNTVTVSLTVPAAPSNLAGSAVRITGSTTNDRVTLTWTDNSNNETGFQIQRARNSFFSQGLNTMNVGANVTTFGENVSRSFDYYYRVRAISAFGNSPWSNVVFVTTP